MAVTAAGTQLTEAHRLEQLAVRAAFLREFLDLWPTLDPIRLDATAQAWLNLVLSLVTRYRMESVNTAVAYYGAYRMAEVGAPSPVEVAGDVLAAAGVAVRTSLAVTGPINIKAKTARGMSPERAAKVALVEASGSAGRHVLNGGREALIEQVTLDELCIGYARVTRAGTCDFCAMLASRGFVYASEFRATKSSGRRGKRKWGESFHDHCKCTAEPAYSRSTPLPETTAQYQAIWESSTVGKSGKAARVAFREALKANRELAPQGA